MTHFIIIHLILSHYKYEHIDDLRRETAMNKTTKTLNLSRLLSYERAARVTITAVAAARRGRVTGLVGHGKLQ